MIQFTVAEPNVNLQLNEMGYWDNMSFDNLRCLTPYGVSILVKKKSNPMPEWRTIKVSVVRWKLSRVLSGLAYSIETNYSVNPNYLDLASFENVYLLRGSVWLFLFDTHGTRHLERHFSSPTLSVQVNSGLRISNFRVSWSAFRWPKLTIRRVRVLFRKSRHSKQQLLQSCLNEGRIYCGRLCI